MTRSYRLPDGTITTDPDTYGEAWLDLAKRAEAIFTGFLADGMDPDISLTLWGTNGLGQSVPIDRVVVSVNVLKLLEEKLKGKCSHGCK